jgi:hypothetical protein
MPSVLFVSRVLGLMLARDGKALAPLPVEGT